MLGKNELYARGIFFRMASVLAVEVVPTRCLTSITLPCSSQKSLQTTFTQMHTNQYPHYTGYYDHSYKIRA